MPGTGRGLSERSGGDAEGAAVRCHRENDQSVSTPFEYVVAAPGARPRKTLGGGSAGPQPINRPGGDRHSVVTTPGAENQRDDVPEADRAEQGVDVDPVGEEAGEPETQAPNLGRGMTEANEADVAEQETGVYGDVDEYRG